ncbi:hypothetical protein DDZ14_00810 [Maritimibacter sp. 55A14]|uniref:hypothetical protein n=1 Tax=Maritimibacter sp. 55A14 TaxID=2174844 RepID=UPI000D6148F2|nr:hypothetical protein [Maritimibacter sp. 55A14]PWE34436.1 hypothetical protein DDZ14_00810 [Maritimibacter sp. 55A14]
MARPKLAADPRGLIYEAYRIEGITEPDCRTIFLDWALGMPDGADMKALIPELLEVYGSAQPDHPMTRVLEAGLDRAGQTGRRGGWAARRGASRTPRRDGGAG